MARFSFLHAADIHLDSPLRGLSKYDGVPADEVRTATRAALDGLVNAAIERAVDFVVIAGDLYDGDHRDVGAGLAVAAAMGRLGRAGIPVYLLAGNHDAESVITKTLPPMANVHTFDTRKPRTHVIEKLGVALHGQSFARREVFDNLARAYPDAMPGLFNIGLLHTSLSGHAEHESYAPCTPAELAAKSYGYWALGHVHEFRIVSQDPYIVFPGNTQGRNIREHGEKGAVLIEVEDDQVQRPTFIPLDVVRWATVTVDVSGVDDMAGVQARLRQALQVAVDEKAGGRPLMARIEVRGATVLHGALQEWAASGRDEVRFLAAEASRTLWVEKIRVLTTPPASPASALDAADDLASLLDDPDPALLAQLRKDFSKFLGKQPAPDPGSLLEAARADDWTALIDRAAAALRARLGAAG